MKFIVSSSALLKQLQAISGALSSNTVLPILENFLFEINSGVLTISATDLQTTMNTTLAVEAKENGKIAVPSKILLDTLKTLADQPVIFSINDENFGIEMSAGDGKYKLSGENGEDFPKIPKVENAAALVITASTLAEAISKTLFAVSTDELRPAMTGVYCQMSSENITFVATDAHKLVRYRRRDAHADVTSSFILPKKALNLLMILKK
jgi:DNA polymerase-3 subunit beta